MIYSHVMKYQEITNKKERFHVWYNASKLCKHFFASQAAQLALLLDSNWSTCKLALAWHHHLFTKNYGTGTHTAVQRKGSVFFSVASVVLYKMAFFYLNILYIIICIINPTIWYDEFAHTPEKSSESRGLTISYCIDATDFLDFEWIDRVWKW